jgi:hypothetical protein
VCTARVRHDDGEARGAWREQTEASRGAAPAWGRRVGLGRHATSGGTWLGRRGRPASGRGARDVAVAFEPKRAASPLLKIEKLQNLV